MSAGGIALSFDINVELRPPIHQQPTILAHLESFAQKVLIGCHVGNGQIIQMTLLHL